MLMYVALRTTAELLIVHKTRHMSEESFTIYLSNFHLLFTEADGGHRYIFTKIDYKGGERVLKAFFAHREDEDRVDETIPVILRGNLLNESDHHPLLLLNAEIMVEEPSEE